MIRLIHTLCLVCVLSAGAGTAHARDVVVFAAASLKNVLDEALTVYQAETGTGVAVSYAGSSALARQIQQGAPADIFISANVDWIDFLDAENLIKPDTRRVLAGNRIVLIGPEDRAVDWSVDAFQDVLGPQGRLAMALVDAVPAGIYGKAALTNLGLWSSLTPFVVQTDNVRAALRLVGLGEAQLAVVYETDARLDDTVHVLARFDADTHPAIAYPVAQVADSDHPQAGSVLAFLSGPTAQGVFAAHGFLPGDAE